jgi:DNA-binding NarL/FixJ family response regulator
MIRARVLLADDQELVRAGIRALLERSAEVEVVGETGDDEEALTLIREQRPDLVLLDITTPAASGLEILERVKKAFPSIRVIMLSAHESEEYALSARRSGAAGFLLKKAPSIDLTTAIAKVMQGEHYFPRRVSNNPGQPTNGRSNNERLTSRQLEVLVRIAEGHSTKEIARSLNISAKTVESHRASLMERLKIHDIVGLVRYAIRMGLVRIDQ